MRDRATQIIAQCPPKARMTELRTLFNFVRETIRYTLDTNEVEVIQTPQRTLELGTGDCDDMCILLAALIELCGHPAWFLALAFNGESDFAHVIVQTSTVDGGRAISLDPTERYPMGWFPPGVTSTMRADI
jgi:transglutaminase-like putative cysteine protease